MIVHLNEIAIKVQKRSQMQKKQKGRWTNKLQLAREICWRWWLVSILRLNLYFWIVASSAIKPQNRPYWHFLAVPLCNIFKWLFFPYPKIYFIAQAIFFWPQEAQESQEKSKKRRLTKGMIDDRAASRLVMPSLCMFIVCVRRSSDRRDCGKYINFWICAGSPSQWDAIAMGCEDQMRLGSSFFTLLRYFAMRRSWETLGDRDRDTS